MQLSNRCHIKQIPRRLPSIKAEVKYVDGVEAKKLVAEEGYTVLDIRDRTQYEKAHIVPSTHIPVYIENTDNDLSNYLSLIPLILICAVKHFCMVLQSPADSFH